MTALSGIQRKLKRGGDMRLDTDSLRKQQGAGGYGIT